MGDGWIIWCSVYFLETSSLLFLRVVVPIYIPTSSNKISPFPMTSPVHLILGLFDNSQSNRCEVILLIVVLMYLMIEILKVSIQVLSHIFDLILLTPELYEFLI